VPRIKAVTMMGVLLGGSRYERGHDTAERGLFVDLNAAV